MKKLFLQKLSLVNFKNWAHAEISFSPRFNFFAGKNGQGKTNLLDAIHYLSFTKSFFNAVDTQNIFYDAPVFVIQGIFHLNETEEEIYCAQKRGERKQFKRNKKEYTRFADHIGMIPLVFISPSDMELISAASEVRRKFIDSIISQYDKTYLEDIILYSKALLQRNALLKQFVKENRFEKEALQAWNAQMIPAGERIYKKRKEFTEAFIPVFQENHSRLCGKKETVSLTYRSQLEENDFEAQMNEALEKDKILGHSTVGIHRDDLNFSMEGRPVKKFASQGQQKTYLLAAKLAQCEFISELKNISPILLLDDIHDKLDESRVKSLIEVVCSEKSGQVFITDTRMEQVVKLFKETGQEIKVFKIKNGSAAE